MVLLEWIILYSTYLLKMAKPSTFTRQNRDIIQDGAKVLFTQVVKKAVAGI